MALEMERACPNCGTESTFYRTASMHLHLGLKTKWTCEECSYRYVLIDGDIDTAAG